MKALSVITKSLYDTLEDSKKHMFSIDNLNIPIGLVETKDTVFEAENTNYSNTVLVKKAGFSLNYRDLGVIEKYWSELKDIDTHAHYPIGSDFCGYVEDFGTNVTGFSKGDLVVGDGTYPYGKHNTMGGIPSNHASKEYEIYHFGKLAKIDKDYPLDLATVSMVGAQTGFSMLKKATIKPEQKVLVTSVSSNTSLYILNMLKDLDCNIYAMSYSGEKIETIKNKFPFLKDIFLFKERNIPKTLLFDAVLDPFSDTHFPVLLKNMNVGCKYITCGIFNQSSHKMKQAKEYKISAIFVQMVLKNISLIGSCLGDSQDLLEGLSLVKKNNTCLVDSIYTETDNVTDFINKTYNAESSKLGKVVFKY